MKIQKVTKYICEVCNTPYATSREAKACESKGRDVEDIVRKGDFVDVLSGPWAGRSKLAVCNVYLACKSSIWYHSQVLVCIHDGYGIHLNKGMWRKSS